MNAVLDNQGTIKIASSDLKLNQATASSSFTLTNKANSTIDVGIGRTLTIGGASVTDNGLIKLEDNAVVDFAVPTVRIDGQGTLQGQSTSTIHVRGSLLGNAANASQYAPQSEIRFDGEGTAASPQCWEVDEPRPARGCGWIRQ